MKIDINVPSVLSCLWYLDLYDKGIISWVRQRAGCHLTPIHRYEIILFFRLHVTFKLLDEKYVYKDALNVKEKFKFYINRTISYHITSRGTASPSMSVNFSGNVGVEIRLIKGVYIIESQYLRCCRIISMLFICFKKILLSVFSILLCNKMTQIISNLVNNS